MQKLNNVHHITHETRNETTKEIRIYSKLGKKANGTPQNCEKQLRKGSERTPGLNACVRTYSNKSYI